MPEAVAVLRGVAARVRHRGPMLEVSAQSLVASRGLAEESGRSPRRGVTILSWESWRDVCRELNRDLPWHTRRANLLISGLDLSAAVGHVLGVGAARIRVHGETKPCARMDEACMGLRAALEPAFRGGVYGEVLIGGAVHVGDAIRVIPATEWEAPARNGVSGE
jgi:MOSC domain-containing protein YiiM